MIKEGKTNKGGKGNYPTKERPNPPIGMNPTYNKIVELIRESIPVVGNIQLSEIGYDSLDIDELCMGIEQEFGVSLEPGLIHKDDLIDDVIFKVNQKLNEQ